MKVQLSMLAAIGVLLAAGAVQAAPQEDLEAFVSRTRVQADRSLDEAGVDLTGRTMAVRVFVDANGHLSHPDIVRSSGSARTDAAVAQALRGILVRAPIDLLGAQVTLALGPRAGRDAKGD
jgi:hypothetical protein